MTIMERGRVNPRNRTEAITEMQTESVYRMQTITWQVILHRCEVQIDKQFTLLAFTSHRSVASCVFVITAWFDTNA